MRTTAINLGVFGRLAAATRDTSAPSSLPTTITALPAGLLLGLTLLETWSNVG